MTNTGITAIITDLENKGRIGDLMAALALKRGNAPARDMFASNGGDIFLDGLDLSPTETIANFLGVSHSYLLNLMTRYGFTPKKTPEDVVASRPSKEFLCSSPYDIYKSDNDSVDFYHRTRYQHITVKYPDTTSYFISPRVALCVCFLMKYGQKIPKNSMAAIIARNAENGSSYGIEAHKLVQCKREEENAKRIIENELEKETASVSLNGDVRMTTEFFASIFKDFSIEFATIFSAEFAKVLAAKGYVPDNAQVQTVSAPEIKAPKSNRTYKNPENWDELVQKFNRGEITAYGIAKLLGWGEKTARKHLDNDPNAKSPATQNKPRNTPKKNPSNWDDLVRRYEAGELTRFAIAQQLGWDVNTVSRHISNYIIQRGTAD